MDDLEPSIYQDELSKALQTLQTLEKERKDIVSGFMKEKEITEKIHNEQLQQLRHNYNQEIQTLREEFIDDKENLLSKIKNEQVEYDALQSEKSRENEIAIVNKSEQEIKNIEESFRNEKRKLREEYESVIKEKTNEIEELYNENYILRTKSDPQSFEDRYKEAEIQINKLKSEINRLKENVSDEIQSLKAEYDFERSEIERKHVLEKAEFVKNLNTKFDKHQEHNVIEKNKTYKKYRNELKEKIEIVEQLWEDRSAEERLKMNMRFENEISELKARFAQDLEEKLLERDSTIESLENEKDHLLNAIHVERFELAKFYNRELSLLNRLDSTKEDIEVALIDEVAKLRDEQQRVIRNMEKRHKRKVNDLKKRQKPLEEILEQHKNDLDDLKSQYEREREDFEAQLRNEQLILLKSFEFEKSDIERYYKQVIEDREKEFKEEIEKIQNEHKKEIEQMGTLEKENNEIKQQLSHLNDKNNELADKIEMFESQNARLQEELEKESRSKREQPDKTEESSSDLKRTIEEISKSNIDLANQLENEQKKCKELLQRTHELEKLHQDFLRKIEKDEIQETSTAEECMVPSFDDEKGQMDIDDSNRFGVVQSNVQKDHENKITNLQGKTPEEKEIELQDNLQEYLLELKALQETLDSKDTEIRALKEENERENKLLKKTMKDFRDAVNAALVGDEAEETLEVFKSRHKVVKDLINREIKDIQGLKDKESNEERAHSDIDTNANTFMANVNALDEIIKAFDENKQQRLRERLTSLKEGILISHDLEMLESQQKHEQEKNNYLKELAYEKGKELKFSEKVFETVCEEIGVDSNERKDKLKEILETDRQSKDENNSIENQSKDFENEELEKLKNDKEELELAIVELEKHFNKEKEKLLKKMQTQHKEFVLSPEAEVIEALTRDKAILEEAFNIERFSLGRLYYMEMQDELDELMKQKMEEVEGEKADIIFKFNEDIAELLQTIAEKDENEVELIKDKNALTRKMLSLKRRADDDDVKKLEEGMIDDMKYEADKLETIIPLKKEIAELQRKRQQEHESNNENLKKAVDVIKGLLSQKANAREGEKRRHSFASTGSQYESILDEQHFPSGRESRTSLKDSTVPQSNYGDQNARELTPNSTHNLTLSPSRPKSAQSSECTDEIHESQDESGNTSTGVPTSNEHAGLIKDKRDLLAALETLIDSAFAVEKTYESDTSSGAISDFESEPATPKPESEDGVTDSGAESVDNECLSIKKSDLELALNMERFGLGRVYYNEYRESLQDAFKKLAREKGKNEILENKLNEGVKDLVNRTSFGNLSAMSMEAETQTCSDSLVEQISTPAVKETPTGLQQGVNIEENSKKLGKGDLNPDESIDKVVESKPSTVEEDILTSKSHEMENTQHAETQTDFYVESPNVQKTERAEAPKIEKPFVEDIQEARIRAAESAPWLGSGIGDLFEGEPENQSGKKRENHEEINDGQQQDNVKDKDEDIYEQEKEIGDDKNLSKLRVKEKGDDEYEIEKENRRADAERQEKDKDLDKGEKEKDINKDQEKLGTNDENTEEELFSPKDESAKKDENADESNSTSVISKAKEIPRKDVDDEYIKDELSSQKEDDVYDEERESSSDQIPGQDEDGKDSEDDNKTNGGITDINDDITKDHLQEYKKLKNNYDILKALVGKGFVEEIPELNEAKVIEDYNDIDEHDLKGLVEEEKNIATDIKSIEKQIATLKSMSDPNVREAEKKLNEKELGVLNELEKIRHALQNEEEKDFIEHLKKEKDEVDKKLKEIEKEFEENMNEIGDEEKVLLDMTSKKLDLESEVAKKANELDKNHKKFRELQEKTDDRNLEEDIANFKKQNAALQDLLQICFSKHNTTDQDPTNDLLDDVNVQAPPSLQFNKVDKPEETMSDYIGNILNNHTWNPKARAILKEMYDKDRSAAMAAKKLKQAQRDRDRLNRMAQDQVDRLKPFLKKQERLQDALGKDIDQSITRTTISNDFAPSRDEDNQIKAGEVQEQEQTPPYYKDKGTKEGREYDESNPQESSDYTNLNIDSIAKECNDIKEKLSNVNNEIEALTNKALQRNYDPRNKSLSGHIQELEDKAAEICVQIDKIKADGLGGEADHDALYKILKEKAAHEFDCSELLSILPEGFQYLPEDIESLFGLACLKDDLEKELNDLEKSIDEEETFYQIARKYKREETSEECHPKFQEIVQKKNNSLKELTEISKEIADVLQKEIASQEVENAMKKKIELEQLVDETQGEIEQEPLRAADRINNLIKLKHQKEYDLAQTTNRLKESKEKVDLGGVPTSVSSAISSKCNDVKDSTTDKYIRDLENNIEETASEIINLNQQCMNTECEEDKLAQLFEKHKPSLRTDTKAVNDDVLPLPSVLDDLQSVKRDIKELESKLDNKKNSLSEDKIEQLQNLEMLIKANHNSAKEEELFSKLSDLDKNKKELQKILKDSKLKLDLLSVTKVVQEKEKDIKRLKDNIEFLDVSLANIMDDVNNNAHDEADFENTIKEVLAEAQTKLEQAEKENETNNQIRQNAENELKDAISSLEDELEENREELEFLENELEDKDIRPEEDNSSLSPELLHMIALLNKKKSLEDYLFEIDTKLSSVDSNKEPMEHAEIDSLRAKKCEAENQLSKIQEEKSKFEVKLPDDEIQETFDALCDEKKQLEDQRKDVMQKIRNGKNFSRISFDTEDEKKPSDEDKKYFIHALNEMIAGPKTLIQLAEENDRLKDIAFNQRSQIEDVNDRLTASLGDQLSKAVLSLDCGKVQDSNIPIIDRINDGQKMGDIVKDLSNENKNLRNINDELLKDLECLKNSIGQNLADFLISPEDCLSDSLGPIQYVLETECTIQEILEELKNDIERAKEALGKNIADFIMSPASDNRLSVEFSDVPQALTIMKDNDDDLESVIVAYEDELQHLGKENYALKSMLGNDLSKALLQIGSESKHDFKPNAILSSRKQPISEGTEKIHGQYNSEEFQEQELAKKRYDEPSRFTKSKKDGERECGDSINSDSISKDSIGELENQIEKHPKDKNVDFKAPEIKYKKDEQEKEKLPLFHSRTDSSQKSIDDKEEWKPVSKPDCAHNKQHASTLQETDKEIVVREEVNTEWSPRITNPKVDNQLLTKCGIEAPIRMTENGMSLGEIIKGYENDLETLKSRLGPGLYESILGACKPNTLQKSVFGIAPEEKLQSAREAKGKESQDVQGENSNKIKPAVSNVLESQNVLQDGEDSQESLDIKIKEDIGKGFKDIKDKECLKQLTEVEKHPDSRMYSYSLLETPQHKMRDMDITLEDVLAEYEDKLELLGRENNALKSMLGNELAQALLEQNRESEKDLKPMLGKTSDNNINKTKVDFKEPVSTSNGGNEPIEETLPLSVRLKPKRMSKKDNVETNQYKLSACDDEHGIVTESDFPESAKTEKGVVNISDKLLIPDEENPLLEQCKLKAPIRIAKDKLTLGDILKEYESDLDTIKLQLGPGLYDCVLDVGKVLEGTTLSTENKNERPPEKEDKDMLQSNEYNEISGVQRESEGQDLLNHRKSGQKLLDVDVNDVFPDAQSKGFVVKPEGSHVLPDASNASEDVIVKSPRQKMMDDDMTLEDVIKEYTGDLKTLKTQIGPELYKSLLDTSRRDDELDKKDQFIKNKPTIDTGNFEDNGHALEKEMFSKTSTSPPKTNRDDDLSKTGTESSTVEDIKTQNVKVPYEKIASKQSERVADQQRRESSLEPGEITLDNVKLYGSGEVKKGDSDETGSLESGEIIDLDVNIDISLQSDGDMLAPLQMKQQNKTLQEVVKGYEHDLKTLKAKLGPELFKGIVDTKRSASKPQSDYKTDLQISKDIPCDGEGQFRPNDIKEIPFRDKQFEKRSHGATLIEQVTPEEKRRPISSKEIPLNEKAKPSLRGTNEISEDTVHQDKRSYSEPSTEHIKPSFDYTMVDRLEYDAKTLGQSAPLNVLDSVEKPEGNMQESLQGINIPTAGPSSEADEKSFPSPIRAIEVVKQPDKTLQDIIEQYEHDLDILKSKLGPNLAKAVVDSESKKYKKGNDENQPPDVKICDQGPVSYDILSEDKQRSKKETREEKGILEVNSNEQIDYCEEKNIDVKRKSVTQGMPESNLKIIKQDDTVHTIEMLDDMTLEDIIINLENELDCLKSKLGADLTKLLLEDSDKNKLKIPGKKVADSKEKTMSSEVLDEQNMHPEPTLLESNLGEKAQRKYSQEPTQELENNKGNAQENIGSGSHEKPIMAKGNVVEGERRGIDDEEDKRPLKYANDQRGESINEVAACFEDIQSKEADTKQHQKDCMSVKRLLATDLMKQQSTPLQEIIQEYENDLSVLKNALGSTLSDMILKKNEVTEQIQDEILQTSGYEEKEGDLSISEQSDESKRNTKPPIESSLSTETIIRDFTTPDQTEKLKDTQKYIEKAQLADGTDKSKAERSGKLLDEVKGKEDEKIAPTDSDGNVQKTGKLINEPTQHGSDSLQNALLPYITGNGKVTIENIIEDLTDDLTTLNKKLGPDLTQSLLAMRTDPSAALPDSQRAEVSASHEYSEGNNEDESELDKSTTEPLTEVDDKMDIMHLKATEFLRKPDKTLQGIIEQYENELEIIKSKLGPNLTNAVLNSASTEYEKDSDEICNQVPELCDIMEKDKQGDKKYIQKGKHILDKKPEKQIDNSEESDNRIPFTQDMPESSLKIKSSDSIDNTMERLEDMTLEDIISDLEIELSCLKSKLGPDLTQLLLDDSDDKKGKILEKPDVTQDKVFEVTSSEVLDQKDKRTKSFVLESDLGEDDQQKYSQKIIQELELEDNNFQRNLPQQFYSGSPPKESNLQRNLGYQFREQCSMDQDNNAEQRRKEYKDEAMQIKSEDNKTREDHDDTLTYDIGTPSKDRDIKQRLKDDVQVSPILATELMKQHNFPLQDVIQNYENDLSVLTNALGPTLCDMILKKHQPNGETHGRVTDTGKDDGKEDEAKMKATPSIEPSLDTTKLLLEATDPIPVDKSKKEKAHLDDNKDEAKAEKKGQLLDEVNVEKDAQITPTNGDDRVENEGEAINEQAKHRSDILHKTLLPYFTGDGDTKIENIIQDLSDDLRALNEKLGPNLTQILLSMSNEPSKSPDTRSTIVTLSQEDNEGNNEEIYIEAEANSYEGKIQGSDNGSQVNDKSSKEKKAIESLSQIKIEDKSEEAEAIDLEALAHISEKDQTLEEIIKRYEDALDRYESALGPHLSYAILSSEQLLGTENEEKRKGHLKCDDNIEEDKPVKEEKVDKLEESHEHAMDEDEDVTSSESPHNFTSKDEGHWRKFVFTKVKDEEFPLEDKNLKEPITFLNEGKTLEDMLSDYENEREMFRSLQSGGGIPLSLNDITETYKKEIEELESKNDKMHKDLNALNEKLGPILFNRLREHQKSDEGNYDVSLEVNEKGLESDTKLPLVSDTLEIEKDEKGATTKIDEQSDEIEKALDKSIKLITQGKTVQDILIEGEKERNILGSIQSKDGVPISIDDIKEAYKKEIEQLEGVNAIVNTELTILDAKLGTKLSNQLKGRPRGTPMIDQAGINIPESQNVRDTEAATSTEKTIDVSTSERTVPLDVNLVKYENTIESLQKGEKQIGKDQEEEREKAEGKYIEHSSLEAPIIMEQLDQTLEEVIADYETQLKEMLTNQEQLKTELDTLELSIGPKLFKELCELNIQEVDDNRKTVKIEDEKLIEYEPQPKQDIHDKDADNVKIKHEKSDFEAINKMAEEDKPLSSVLDDYQGKCHFFERENASLKNALSGLSGDLDVGQLISKYENKIQTLENANKEAQKEFENKHNELQTEIDDLKDTLEKLAQTLRQDFLDDLMKQQDSENRIQALQKMEKENKTLAEVVEEYEDNMKRLEKEKAVLEQLAGQGDDGVSMLDRMNDYEDSIQNLKDVNKMLNKRLDEFSGKLGPKLTDELIKLSLITDKESEKLKDDEFKDWFPAVKRMKKSNDTLEEVLACYESKESPSPNDVISKLKEKIGEHFIDDINDLDNQSIEELIKKDKRPIALLIMKKRNENLGNVIKQYEDYLLKYGVLDSLQGESLASELEDAFEESIAVDVQNEPLLSEIKSDTLASGYDTLFGESFNLTGEMPDDSQLKDGNADDCKDIQLQKLQKQLEEEKELKEKYQRDVEELLNDIVQLKLKNASDDEDKEEIERQIKEEHKTKQQYQELKHELANVRKSNNELQKSNDDLTNETKTMENQIRKLENKLSDLAKTNEELEKVIENLKNQLKENVDNLKTEKGLDEDTDQKKKDTIKDLLEAKEGAELKLQEQLILYRDLEEKLKVIEEGLDNDEGGAETLKQIKIRNEALKQQLDHAEESMKEALEKYKEQIRDLEIEQAKTEEEKKRELEILNNKLELEKRAYEKLKEEYSDNLKKEKDKIQEDFDNELEREKRRSRKDLEEQMEDLERLKKKHEQELDDLNEKSKKEKGDLTNLFEEEKQQLQRELDDKVRKEKEDHEKELKTMRQVLEDRMIAEKAELNVRFNQEKTELQVQIEKDVYGEEIQKNIDLENNFQGTLNQVLQDHASEIENIDREMKQADEYFKEQKYKLLEEFEKEREKEKQEQQKLRFEMESNIENMLKEIIKLKHQRKEMRHQHRLEKQTMEELFDKERNEIQESIEQSKNELLSKLKEEHAKELSHERENYEEMLNEMKEALEKSEAKRKELEDKLHNEELKVEESKLNNAQARPLSPEVQKEIKVIKRKFEVEYEQKLSIEKQRFEETLQGLRKEVGTLQEKRKIIQERVYNQEGGYAAEKHVIEKSIANYKMEVLAKLEGEMAQRMSRERKPLEEEIKELQTENEELKRQRWEMKIQFRREKATIEEKYEKEKEAMEHNFSTEREEMRKRLEATIQKQDKINKTNATALHGETLSSPRIDNTVRMLQQENLSLVTQNARLEADVEKLSEKLESIEGNFKEMIEYEKSKAERVGKIRDEMPKTALFKDIPGRPAPEYQPSASSQDDAMFHRLQEQDHQIHQLLETKKYYESVLGELCDEAGLFELDRNEVV